MEERPPDCCCCPPDCQREDCSEFVAYREWEEYWDTLTPAQKAEDLYWQAVYADESSREARGEPPLRGRSTT